MKRKGLTLLSAIGLTGVFMLSACSTSEIETSTTPPQVETTTTTTPNQEVYVVTFDFSSDVANENVEVLSGNKVTKPSNPTKDGYDFIGWYLGDTLYDFNSVITKNITLIAKYTKQEVKYTVSFNIDGTISTVEVSENNKVLMPVSPTKDGYKFIGWYLGDTLFDFDSEIVCNITLIARFEAFQTYTVTFKSESGDVLSTSFVTEGDSVSRPENPTDGTKVFLGWYESLTDEAPFEFITIISSDLTLYAKFQDEIENEDFLYTSYNEGTSIEFSGNSASNYTIKYQEIGNANQFTLDKSLIRKVSDDTIRADIVGLKNTTYKVYVYDQNQTLVSSKNVEIESYDRSGYAHFNTSGVGAYSDDGTLKENTTVVYVTDQNKNTVTALINGTTYTGLANILKNQSKSKVPLDIRIIGTINASTWNKLDYGNSEITIDKVVGVNNKALTSLVTSLSTSQKLLEADLISNGYNSMSDDINAGITKLNGLTNQIAYDKSGEFDSYYNMLDISSAKNVTVEGIGTDAVLYQWGFTWKSSSSIEIRNLTFDDYTEDACSFEGPDDSTTLSGFTTGHIWIHNNTFNEGKNNWDVCAEQDKHEGDGATDFKKNAYITLSYNHYYKNHKTGLVGGSDTQHTASITFHHNFYDNCNSRLPLGRQANMHMYNNYYYKSTGTNMSLRAGAYALIEGCYFEQTNNPIEIKGTAVAKVYNSVFDNTKGTNNGTVVTSRDKILNNANLYGTTFDTNSSVFYYDATNKKSNVTYITDAITAKEDCIKYAGVLK